MKDATGMLIFWALVALTSVVSCNGVNIYTAISNVSARCR